MTESRDQILDGHQLRLFDYTPLISSEEIPTANYSLRIGDFSDENKPKIMQPWEYPQPVSRDNFIPYTVAVFGFSKGSPTIHAMYMQLIRERTGFDGFTSNSAFKSAGGWNALSTEEQTYFKEAFKSVFRHGAERRYEPPGNRFKSVGEELLYNLPVNPSSGLNHTIFGREVPINYHQDDADIFAFLRQKRREDAAYRALQID